MVDLTSAKGKGMADVAARAKVSISTVSHVLNGTRSVAPETRKRVERAIAELAYVRNDSARMLVRGQSDAVGMIISDVGNPFFPEIIKSFEQRAFESGLHTIVAATNYNAEQAEQAVRRMLEARVRAVAVVTASINDAMLQPLIDRKIPFVRMHGGVKRSAYGSITIDYQRGVSQAIQHLCALGHQRIAVLAGPGTRASSRLYREAVLNSLRSAGLEPVRVLETNNRPEDGHCAVRELFARPGSPEALVCENDAMAIGALSAAWRLGIPVPGQLSVVGMDDVFWGMYANPPLTTVRVPRDELGAACFETIDAILRGRKSGLHRTLTTELVIRESTGRPARKP